MVEEKMKNARYFDLLTADPYRLEEVDDLHIDEAVFYDSSSGFYVNLDNDEDIIQAIETGEKIKQIRINGYAKSGKTVLCNSLINRLGCPDGFKYGFNEGGDENFGILYTIDLMLDVFFRQLWSRRKDADILELFMKTGKELKGDPEKDRWFRVLNRLFYTDGLMLRLCNEDKSEDDVIADLKEWFYRATIIDITHTWNEVTKFGIQGMIDQKRISPYELFMEVLVLDYLLRCSIALKREEYRERSLFCLLDNLDNLAEDTLVSLYTALVHTIHLLKSFRRELIDKKRLGQNVLRRYGAITFVYLFPTREVTDRKLDQGLARISQKEIQQGLYDHFTFDISSHTPNIWNIFEKRLRYWKERGYRSSEIPYYQCLREVNIERPISELLNGNYLMIIGTLCNVSGKWSGYYSQQQEPGLTLEGRRGLLIRLVLEYFKEKDIFAEPRYEEIDNVHKLIGGRLGLFDFQNPDEGKEEEGFRMVTLSRVLLTYLSNCEDGCESIKKLFKNCGMFGKTKLCESLFALGHGQKNMEVWRRLLLFGNNIPDSVDDLYRQAENSFLQNAKASDVEICRAGRAYLNYIVPSFEFLSCRLNSLEAAPPLFSAESIRGDKWKQTIEDVISKIEERSYNYSMFDKRIIAELKENRVDDDLPKFFFVNDYKYLKNAEGEKPQQYHLARMIFSQVGYIDNFRKYLLSGKGKKIGSEIYLTDRTDIRSNQHLISFIVRYLALFDKEPLLGDFIQLLDNPVLRMNHYQIRLERGATNTCKDVHAELMEKCVERRALKRISNSFVAQGRAYQNMMESILEIHQSDYTLVGTINATDVTE